MAFSNADWEMFLKLYKVSLSPPCLYNMDSCQPLLLTEWRFKINNFRFSNLLLNIPDQSYFYSLFTPGCRFKLEPLVLLAAHCSRWRPATSTWTRVYVLHSLVVADMYLQKIVLISKITFWYSEFWSNIILRLDLVSCYISDVQQRSSSSSSIITCYWNIILLFHGYQVASI